MRRGFAAAFTSVLLLSMSGFSASGAPAPGPSRAVPSAAPVAPSRIAGYAALTDPATGHRYVQRSYEAGGSSVLYGLKLQAIFQSAEDRSALTVDVCHFTCGNEVDDAGRSTGVSSPRTTAFLYSVSFRREGIATPVAEEQRAPTGFNVHLVRYDPARWRFIELRALMDIYDNSGRVVRTIRLGQAEAPFPGLPNP